jgi:hypothetical protein
MAIDTQVAKFLLTCRREGVSFRYTLTLGRLNYFPGLQETRNLLRRGGIDIRRFPKLLDYESSRYAETFFEVLGAERIESLDASVYEGATVVHDLNLPVPEELRGKFDQALATLATNLRTSTELRAEVQNLTARVLDHPDMPQNTKEKLSSQIKALNPFLVQKQIQRKLRVIFKLLR